jgi:MFS transporter, PAT family, beta-lactamase induction signal transducer AmpG
MGASVLSEAGQSVTSTSPSILGSIKPYLEKESLAALAVGISSGFPFSMIGATLTSRLADDGIDKKTITAFTLAFLVYNLKFLWAWIVDGVKLPVLGRLGQRVSWMIVAGFLVMAAVINLAFVDPKASISATVTAAILVAIAGSTFDIVIDAYRIETLKPHQLGVGSGMSQYGWRIGAAAAGGLALWMADHYGWTLGYAVCAIFALPAMLTGLFVGEPPTRKVTIERRGISEVLQSIVGPFMEFFKREGAFIVLAFILIHKIGDTLANLTLRLLYKDMGFSKSEIAFYDVGIGFWATLIGIFVGGVLYAKLGLKRSVLIALVLMAVSNFSFALLWQAGKSNWGMASAMGFENFASGLGGVVVVAYFAALCDLRFTAAQYALISAGSSVAGRLVTGTTAGGLIKDYGYFNFYVFTTLLALPGIALFWWMIRTGLVDSAMGSVGTQAEKAQSGG